MQTRDRWVCLLAGILAFVVGSAGGFVLGSLGATLEMNVEASRQVTELAGAVADRLDSGSDAETVAEDLHEFLTDYQVTYEDQDFEGLLAEHVSKAGSADAADRQGRGNR